MEFYPERRIVYIENSIESQIASMQATKPMKIFNKILSQL